MYLVLCRTLLFSYVFIINCYAYSTVLSNSDDTKNFTIQVSQIRTLIQQVSKNNIPDVISLYADSVSYTFSDGSTFYGNTYEWISFLQSWRSSKDTLIPHICTMIVSKDTMSTYIELHHSWISSTKGIYDTIIRTSVFRFNNNNKIQSVSQFDRSYFTSYDQLQCSNSIVYADSFVQDTIHSIIKQLLLCENTSSWYKNKYLFNPFSLSVFHSNNNINSGNTSNVLELLDESSKVFQSINSMSSHYYTYSINKVRYISLYGNRFTVNTSLKEQKNRFHRIIALDTNNTILYILAKAQKDK